MQITQIQVVGDTLQDRLLMRIATASHEEIRVHLTRRFVRELWPHLVTLLADHLSTPAASEPASAENLKAAAPSTAYDEPYRNDNPTYPLGSTPLLASEAVLEATGPGKARMILREARERAFTLALNAELLQGLCAMLRSAATKSGWDLALDYSGPPAGAPRTPAGTLPKPTKILLH